MENFNLAELAPDLSFIVDPNTSEILSVSEDFQKILGTENPIGKKCREFFCCNVTPCRFYSSSDSQNVQKSDCGCRFVQFSKTNRMYLIKSKLIEQNGKKRRLFILMDVTAINAQKKELKLRMSMETELLSCVKELSSTSVFSESMYRSLSRLGEFLKPTRLYIYEYEEENMRETHVWRAKGGTYLPAKVLLPKRLTAAWEPSFRRGDDVIIHSVEEIKQRTPEGYKIFLEENIHTFIAVPLCVGSEVIGFLGAENISEDLIPNVEFLFRTLSCVYANTIMRYQLYKQMKHLSCYDSLTGLHNRNSYIKDLKVMRANPPKKIGVVFMDVNGLKCINDTYGHDCGDAVLQFTGEQLRTVFSDYKCYRLGGDEFLVLCTEIEKCDFQRKVERLTEALTQNHNLTASVGAKWQSEVSDLNELIGLADKEMYQNKRKFHLENEYDSVHPSWMIKDSPKES